MKSPGRTNTRLQTANPAQFMPRRGKSSDPPLPAITRNLDTVDWGTLILKHAAAESEPFELQLTATGSTKRDKSPVKRPRFLTQTVKRGNQTTTHAASKSSDSCHRSFDDTFKRASDSLIEDLEFAKAQTNLSTVDGIMSVMDAVTKSIKQMVVQLNDVEQGNQFTKIMKICEDSVKQFVATHQPGKKPDAKDENRTFKRDQMTMTENQRANLLSEEDERFIEFELNQQYRFDKEYAEIREKLTRLNKTTTTAASDLLNDIYNNMNSKVKSVPEVQAREYEAAEVGDWTQDMNQKMHRMQKETAKTIFSKYIVKSKDDVHSQTEGTVVSEQEFIKSEEQRRLAETKAREFKKEKDKAVTEMQIKDEDLKKAAGEVQKFKNECQKACQQRDLIKQREQNMVLEVQNAQKRVKEIEDANKESLSTIRSQKAEISDLSRQLREAMVSVGKKDALIRKLKQKLKAVRKQAGLPEEDDSFMDFGGNSSEEDYEDSQSSTMKSRNSPGRNSPGVGSNRNSKSGAYRETPRQIASRNNRGGYDAGSPDLNDLDADGITADGSKNRARNARKFGDVADQVTLEEVGREDDDNIWSPESGISGNHRRRGSPSHRRDVDSNSNVSGNSMDSGNGYGPAGSHRWARGQESPNGTPSLYNAANTPLSDLPGQRWSNITKNGDDQYLSPNMAVGDVHGNKKTLHAKSSLRSLSPIRLKSREYRDQRRSLSPNLGGKTNTTNATDTIEFIQEKVDQNSVGVQFCYNTTEPNVGVVEAQFYRDPKETQQSASTRVVRPQTVIIAKNPSSFYGLRGDVFYSGRSFTAASKVPFNHKPAVIGENSDEELHIRNQELSPKYKLEIDMITFDQHKAK